MIVVKSKVVISFVLDLLSSDIVLSWSTLIMYPLVGRSPVVAPDHLHSSNYQALYQAKTLSNYSKRVFSVYYE
jgi:hypothetical protein